MAGKEAEKEANKFVRNIIRCFCGTRSAGEEYRNIPTPDMARLLEEENIM